MRRRYLAYGSNLCAEQMRQRCPAAEPAGLVRLEGWRFIINREGFATLLPCPGDHAHGLVWHLTVACEAALDGYEGVATGEYRKAELPAGAAPALIYFAAEERPGYPRPGYLERILRGGAEQGLPRDYLAQLGAWAGAVTPALLHRALAGYRLPLGGIHGPGHWLRVLENGRTLASLTPGADPALVELFALLHDCRRHDEGSDRGHGERAATLVRQLAAEGLLGLAPARAELLADACARHEHGEVSGDPTLGCCWDADRLELSRLNRRPLNRLLSTTAALGAAVQAAAWQRGQDRVALAELAAVWGLEGASLAAAG